MKPPYSVSIQEAASRLSVTEKTLATARQRGVLPMFKVGKLWRIAEDDLARYCHGYSSRGHGTGG